MERTNEYSESGKYFLIFGIFEGMNYSNVKHEKFDDYKKFKNKISKQKIIAHIKKTRVHCIITEPTYDIFTKKNLGSAGFYIDGDFMFPLDFLHYLKNYDIGVPYEYETYLQSIGIDK